MRYEITAAGNTGTVIGVQIQHRCIIDAGNCDTDVAKARIGPVSDLVGQAIGAIEVRGRCVDHRIPINGVGTISRFCNNPDQCKRLRPVYIRVITDNRQHHTGRIFIHRIAVVNNNWHIIDRVNDDVCRTNNRIVAVSDLVGQTVGTTEVGVRRIDHRITNNGGGTVGRSCNDINQCKCHRPVYIRIITDNRQHHIGRIFIHGVAVRFCHRHIIYRIDGDVDCASNRIVAVSDLVGQTVGAIEVRGRRVDHRISINGVGTIGRFCNNPDQCKCLRPVYIRVITDNRQHNIGRIFIHRIAVGFCYRHIIHRIDDDVDRASNGINTVGYLVGQTVGTIEVRGRRVDHRITNNGGGTVCRPCNNIDQCKRLRPVYIRVITDNRQHHTGIVFIHGVAVVDSNRHIIHRNNSHQGNRRITEYAVVVRRRHCNLSDSSRFRELRGIDISNLL